MSTPTADHEPGRWNVAGALAAQAHDQATAPAIHYPTGIRHGRVSYRSASYRELDELSDSYARGLQEFGIGRGVRTALMVPPGLEFFALFFALFKAGAVPVLIDPGIGLKPLKHCLAEAAPEAFIGVTRAQLARAVLRWSPDTISKTVTVGRKLLPGGINSRQLAALGQRSRGTVLADTRPGEMAAVLFTSGSTGIPKGVVYRHRHFVNQVELLRETFAIEAGEIDLPTFPPFALFDPALGMATVIPWMDPTRPAKANPELLVEAIRSFGVTNVFGSPALLKVLGTYTSEQGIQLPTVRRIISAGAAMPVATLRRMQKALTGAAAVHTPYGATECLPVTSISAVEIGPEEERAAANGLGVCVGRPVQPNRVAIISVTDAAHELLLESDLLATGQAGEVLVHGPTTTDAYWQKDEQTRLAKSTDEQGRVWHRMGDIGYLDDQGRLWYCGRKSQRVRLGGIDLYPDQVEAFFNVHPEVERTALVGVGTGTEQEPVLCVELPPGGGHDLKRIEHELLERAAAQEAVNSIRTVLFHPGFPVDIRHNAKIGREALARWAEGRLS
jgi:acyl-CoA synthetase (AMP-forming)/AMP-acid ligase II